MFNESSHTLSTRSVSHSPFHSFQSPPSLGKDILKVLLKELTGLIVDFTLEVIDIGSDIASFIFVIYEKQSDTVVAAYSVFLAVGLLSSINGITIKLPQVLEVCK